MSSAIDHLAVINRPLFDEQAEVPEAASPKFMDWASNLGGQTVEFAREGMGRLGEAFGAVAEYVGDRAPQMPRPSSRYLGRLAGLALLITGVQAEAASAKATRAADSPAPVTFKAYANTNTDSVIGSLQRDLLTDKGIVIKGVNLSPSTLSVQGDCDKASTYSSWLDTPASLQQTRCDDPAEVTTPHGTDPTLQTRYQSELNKVGSDIANAIPGNSVDFKQTAIGLSGEASQTVSETFECPPPNSKLAAGSFQSFEVSPDNTVNATFCPSNMLVYTSPVNTQDPTFAPAFARYQADPYRSGKKWIGDEWRYTMFVACPEQTGRQDPRITFQYRPKQEEASVSFDGGGYRQYCDLVGRYTERITAQIKTGAGKFRDVGRRVLHIDGLREILAYNYGMLPKNQRDRVIVPDIGELCEEGHQDEKMRIKIHEVFTAKRSETFQRLAQYGFTDGRGMRGSADTYITRARDACSTRRQNQIVQSTRLRHRSP